MLLVEKIPSSATTNCERLPHSYMSNHESKLRAPDHVEAWIETQTEMYNALSMPMPEVLRQKPDRNQLLQSLDPVVHLHIIFLSRLERTRDLRMFLGICLYASTGHSEGVHAKSYKQTTA